jgi:hypothetical protein
MKSVLLYYARILAYLEAHSSKDDVAFTRRFTPAPQPRIRRQFATIDKTVLRDALLWEAPKTMDDDALWKVAFPRISAIKRNWDFHKMVQSDGVSLCVHFWTLKSKASTTRHSRKRPCNRSTQHAFGQQASVASSSSSYL